MESGYQVDVIFTDFVKAFDTVCHAILINKLKSFGIHSTLLKWISSYLLNRKQIVKIGCTQSRLIEVLSGVPQGSHLGPLLFNIFINDVPTLLHHVDCLMYADDLKIFLRVKNIYDCGSLQNDLDKIVNWCELNRLSLNINKCHSFSVHRTLDPIIYDYKIYATTLDRKTEVKDLGVLFDTKLSFSFHIDYVVAKANSMLGFIKRTCAEFSNPYALKSVYMSLVRPFLEYCSIVWCPIYCNSIIRLERVQKSFTRFVVKQMKWNLDVMPSYLTRCALIGLDTLEKRRNVHCILFIHDVFSYRIICPDILQKIQFYAPERILRTRNFLLNPRHIYNYGLNEPITKCIKLFNSVCTEIDLYCDRSNFKLLLFDIMISH